MMIKLNYNFKIGDAIHIPLDKVRANISSFQCTNISDYVIEEIDKKKESCYLSNSLVLPFEVAAYFAGDKVDNDFISHKTTEYLPELNETVIVKGDEFENWSTYKLWCTDFSMGRSKNGLDLKWYLGGYNLNTKQIWKYISDD